MSDPTDPWHFARPELAQAYLQGFDLGLISARGLFARRMCKSEFLQHDLLPDALPAGYQDAYTNLWGGNKHPGQALATDIVVAMRPKRPDALAEWIGVVIRSGQIDRDASPASIAVQGRSDVCCDASLAELPDLARLLESIDITSGDQGQLPVILHIERD